MRPSAIALMGPTASGKTALALDWAGARTPRLRHVIRLNSDVTLLVHDHIPGRPVGKLTADELTDEVVDDTLGVVLKYREDVDLVRSRRAAGSA